MPSTSSSASEDHDNEHWRAGMVPADRQVSTAAPNVTPPTRRTRRWRGTAHSASVVVSISCAPPVAELDSFGNIMATCSSEPAHATACSRVVNTGMKRCGPSGGHISGLPCAVVMLSHASAFITTHNAEQGAARSTAGALGVRGAIFWLINQCVCGWFPPPAAP